jgi:hypothetical protein
MASRSSERPELGSRSAAETDGREPDTERLERVTDRLERVSGRPGRRYGHLGRWRRILALVAGIVVVVVVLAGGLRVAGLWPHLRNPFGGKTTDRSQPTLLLSITDLSRFDAASGNFQVVVDLQKEKAHIPDVIFNQRTLFVAAGTVDVYVDFGKIGQGDVTTSPDRRSAQIRLPAPQLDRPNLDHNRSEVVAVQQGIVNRLGDLFGNGNPNREQELYQLGEQKISEAARDSGLAQRAQDNTRRMLEGLLHSLGYTAITVSFAAS